MPLKRLQSHVGASMIKCILQKGFPKYTLEPYKLWESYIRIPQSALTTLCEGPPTYLPSNDSLYATMLGCFIWPSTDTSLRASSLSFRDICMCTVHNKPTTKLLTSCEAIHDLSHQFTQGHTLQLVTKDTHCNLSHTATCHTGHTLQLGTQGHTLQLGTQDTHCNLSHRDKHCNLSHRDTHCNLSHKDTHCNLSHRTHTATCHTGTHTATNLSHRTHTTVLHKTHD